MAARTRPPRVLHLVTRYRQGGSEQRVRDLVRALPDCEHVVVVGDDSDIALAADQLGVTVELEPRLVRSVAPLTDLALTVTLARRIRRDRPDVLVTHQSKAGALGRIAARLGGRVPVVHSLSMASFGPGYPAAESRVYRAVERALAPLTARYSVVGADLARRFEVAGIAARKLVIVRSAAMLPEERPSSPPAVPGVPDGRPVVLALGALEDRKHPLDLVRLLAAVQRDVPDAFLAIAGEGPLAEALTTAVAASGLDDSVALLGYVKPVEPLLWRADALVLLSEAEGLPQVLIQAAAAGTPFVTYDIDGAREVLALGAVGEVVPMGAVAEAAAATTRILGSRPPRQRRVDVRSWDTAVIDASYRALVGDVLGIELAMEAFEVPCAG